MCVFADDCNREREVMDLRPKLKERICASASARAHYHVTLKLPVVQKLIMFVARKLGKPYLPDRLKLVQTFDP